MVSKLRIKIFLIFVVLSSITLAACGNKSGRSNVATVEMSAGGKAFAVPTQHLTFLQPSARVSPMSGPTGGRELSVHFSAAWLSAHIDGYQPILNKGFEGGVVRVAVGSQIKKDHARLHPPTVDLWFKRGTYENRIIMDKRESNTGFYVIQPIPYQSRPEYEGEQWHLAETLPDESKPYPENPRWRPYLCSRTKGLIEEAEVFTRCYFSAKAADDIFFDINLSSENLQIREAVFSTLANEINSWIIDKGANHDH